LHLLLRSPSFSRWPLEIRFFSKTVHNAWVRWTKAAPDPIPDTIRIIKDFSEGTGKGSDVEDAEAGTANAKIYRRMAYLPVDYDIKKSHVEKAKDIIDFEREGSCNICKKDLKHDGGLYTVCPGTGCETVTHMACLSKHFIAEQDQDELVPISGKCPSCDIELIWVELVKELTLRMRGQKEVQNLLKVKRVKKGKASELSQTVANSSDMEQESDDDLDIDEDIDMKDFATQSKEAPPGDSWHIANETDASDAESVASTSSLSKKKKPSPTRKSRPAPARRQIVEDSDWDEAEILD
jgi:structure-specific endonuclease subunit SLX1